MKQRVPTRITFAPRALLGAALLGTLLAAGCSAVQVLPEGELPRAPGKAVRVVDRRQAGE